MPNWCENELKIWGKAEDVQSVLDRIRKEDNDNPDEDPLIDFNKIIPYPEEYRVQDEVAKKAEAEWRALPEGERPPYSTLPKDGFNSGGYHWCIANWGTKWNACDVMEIRDGLKGTTRTYGVGFSTAWSPPEPIIRKLGETFPTVNFQLKYWEGGVGFKGTLEIRKGECVKDETDNSYRGGRGG